MNERRGMTVLVHSGLVGTRGRLLLTGLLAILRVCTFVTGLLAVLRVSISLHYLTSLLAVLLVCDSVHTSHWSISRSSVFCFLPYF